MLNMPTYVLMYVSTIQRQQNYNLNITLPRSSSFTCCITSINPEINIGTIYQEVNPSNISLRTNVGYKLNTTNTYSNNIGDISDLHDIISLNISNIYDDDRQLHINTP